MAISVLMIGIALQHTWHHMIVAVFFGGQVMGIMIATTALNAYLLDAYPEGSGDVGAWVNVGRTMGGFMATYVSCPVPSNDVSAIAGSGAVFATIYFGLYKILKICIKNKDACSLMTVHSGYDFHNSPCYP